MIPADKSLRWKRQMQTEYEDLPEDEKSSDLDIALLYMDVLQ